MNRMKKALIGVAALAMVASPALACDLKTGIPYQVAGDGTGAVGPFVNGTVEFEANGDLNGVLYGRWYGHGDCVVTWSGTYSQEGDSPIKGLSYTATVTATGDCIPKNAQPKTLILIPSNGGNHFGWGIYNDNSHIHGEGNIQD